jgi:hypothetical protein
MTSPRVSAIGSPPGAPWRGRAGTISNEGIFILVIAACSPYRNSIATAVAVQLAFAYLRVAPFLSFGISSPGPRSEGGLSSWRPSGVGLPGARDRAEGRRRAGAAAGALIPSPLPLACGLLVLPAVFVFLVASAVDQTRDSRRAEARPHAHCKRARAPWRKLQGDNCEENNRVDVDALYAGLC